MGALAAQALSESVARSGTLRSMKPNGLASWSCTGHGGSGFLLCALGFHTLWGFSSGYGAEWHDPSAY
jgi:hypothetical protein